jgi:hypothetical protein
MAWLKQDKSSLKREEAHGRLFGGFTPPAAWQTSVVVFHNLFGGE